MTADGTPVSRARRGAYKKTSARRRAIIEAATEVFGESGYRAGSMKEIAGRSGLSEAGLLHHFPSKALLLRGVLEVGDELDGRMDEYPPSSGLLHLQGVVALGRHNAAIPGRQTMINALVHEARDPAHPAHEYFQDRFRMIADQLRTAFRRIADDGELRAELRPEEAAVIALTALLGLHDAVVTSEDGFDYPSMLQRVFGLLLKSGKLPD